MGGCIACHLFAQHHLDQPGPQRWPHPQSESCLYPYRLSYSASKQGVSLEGLISCPYMKPHNSNKVYTHSQTSTLQALLYESNSKLDTLRKFVSFTDFVQLLPHFAPGYVFIDQSSALQGPCPNCNAVANTYFGDILTIPGAREKNDIVCSNCKASLSFNAVKGQVLHCHHCQLTVTL